MTVDGALGRLDAAALARDAGVLVQVPSVTGFDVVRALARALTFEGTVRGVAFLSRRAGAALSPRRRGPPRCPAEAGSACRSRTAPRTAA